MSTRLWLIFLVVIALASIALARNKKKQVLPDYVLNAQTVFVVIDPGAGEPVTDPTTNRRAQENVEQALMKWGRFKLVMEPQTADLVIAVRKGHANGPTVRNLPSDNRPVVIQPSDGNIRIGGQQGRGPDLQNPGLGAPPTGPRVGNEIGPTEDTLAVYRGGVEYPLDSPAVWRCMGKSALDGPQVKAIEQFHDAVNEAEKQRQHKR